MTSEDSVTTIKGIGDSTAKLFALVGIHTISDLINYYPRAYNDYSNIQKIVDIKPGQVSIKATIQQTSGRYVRRGMHITEAVAQDDSGSIRLVWFNQPYRSQSIKAGHSYYISGNFELSHQKFAIMNPACEKESDFPINTARILPIYRETKGLKSSHIRKVLKQIAPLLINTPETLPMWILDDHMLLTRNEAVYAIHFPENAEQLAKAKRVLDSKKFFELTLAALMNKAAHASEHALQIPFDRQLAQKFVNNLPFQLTDDQKRVIWQIYQDIEKQQPMNRLIEGDVGSGKTVVATMSALMALKHGFQVAFMAPTELLARQLADTIYNLVKPLGYESMVGLLGWWNEEPAKERNSHSNKER
jgi:ATP-dependent DNA helicase RecG